MKTYGDLRKNLADCFIMAKNGELSGDALRGVIGAANQINISIANETKARELARRASEAVVPLGDLPLHNGRE